MIGRRVVGALLDGALWAAIALATFLAVAHALPPGTFDALPSSSLRETFAVGDTTHFLYGGAAAAHMLFVLAVGLALFVALPARTGWTPGKRVTGLRVEREDGSRPGAGALLGRWLLWVADGFPYVLPGLVGFVVVVARRDRRRLGDLATGTRVVRR